MSPPASGAALDGRGQTEKERLVFATAAAVIPTAGTLAAFASVWCAVPRRRRGRRRAERDPR